MVAIGFFDLFKRPTRPVRKDFEQVGFFSDDATAYGVTHGLTIASGIEGYWRMYKVNPIVRSCVDRIVQACSEIEFVPINDDDDVQDDIDHANAVFSEVNELDSAVDVFQFSIKQQLVQGYGPIEWQAKGDRLGMWNVEGEVVPVIRSNRLEGYRHKPDPTSGWKDVDKDALLWIRQNADRSYYAASPLESIKREVQADAASINFNVNYYENPTHFGREITIDGEDARVRSVQRQIESQFRGSKKAFKNWYHGAGVESKFELMSARDMEALDFIDRIGSRIRMVYGVPPQLLGIETPGKLGGVDDTQVRIFESAVMQWERPLEYQINRHIMPLISDRIRFQFSHDDTTSQKIAAAIEYQEAQTEALLVQCGIKGINEARMKYGLEPVEETEEEPI